MLAGTGGSIKDARPGDVSSAFGEFATDVTSGAYPEQGHNVAIADSELNEFIRRLDG